MTHALLTRPPRYSESEDPEAFDLHVLGAPPAFILSQDQTLRFFSKEPYLPGCQRSRPPLSGSPERTLYSYTPTHGKPSGQTVGRFFFGTSGGAWRIQCNLLKRMN